MEAKERGPMLFHCAPVSIIKMDEGKDKVLKGRPTHSLLFHRRGDDLLMTYARPHPGLDTFNRKYGKQLCETRMGYLQNRLDSEEYASRAVIRCTVPEMEYTMPIAITEDLAWYILNAIRHFAMTVDTVDNIIYRTDRRSNRVVRVAVKDLDEYLDLKDMHDTLYPAKDEEDDEFLDIGDVLEEGGGSILIGDDSTPYAAVDIGVSEDSVEVTNAEPIEETVEESSSDFGSDD